MFFVHFGIGLLILVPTVCMANTCFFGSMEDNIDWLNLKRIFHLQLTTKERILHHVMCIKQDDWNIEWDKQNERFVLQHNIFRIIASGWHTDIFVKVDGRYELLNENYGDDTLFNKLYREDNDSKWVMVAKMLERVDSENMD